MSKCALSVELIRSDLRLVAGEKVEGQVVAHATAECRCNRLTVALIWRPHGHGRSDEGARVERVLFEGSWREGETHRFPFEIELPDGPLTYHGEHLNVDWLVVADADIASGLDAHAEETLLVQLGDDPGRVPLPRGRDAVQAARLGLVSAIAKTLGGLVIGAPGWIVLVLGILGVTAGQSAAWMGVVAGAVFALAGTTLAVKGTRWLLGASLLKVMHLSLDPPACRAGGEVGVTLMFTPRRAVEIDEISATLEGEETVSYGRSDGSTRYTHTLAHEVATMQAPPSVRPGAPISVGARLNIPSSAPHSFRLASAGHYWALEWKVRVKVGIRGRPDWTRDLILVVGP